MSRILPVKPTDDIKWDYLRSPSGKVVRRREVTDHDQDQWTDHLHFNDAQGTAKNEEDVRTARAQPDIGQEKSGDAFPFVLELKVSPDFSAGGAPAVSAISFDIYFHPQYDSAIA